MAIKKIIGKLHLWLGLSSGIVVFIVAITGCIYAFQEEIQDLTQPYRFVDKQKGDLLSPSEIRKIADEALPNKHIHGVLYKGEYRAAIAIYYSYEDGYYDLVYVNPYSGSVLKVVDVYQTFFQFILDGHFTFGFHMRSGSLWSLFLRLSLLSCLLVALSYGGPETKMAPVNVSVSNGVPGGGAETMTCTMYLVSMPQPLLLF